jgi:hypothetical protein
VLVVTRFRVTEDPEAFRAELESAHSALASQRGYVQGHVGRNVDEPELWVLQTMWEGPGAYRRALSAYDVKVVAWPVLGRAVEEPSAYEVVLPDEPLNDMQPRTLD